MKFNSRLTIVMTALLVMGTVGLYGCSNSPSGPNTNIKYEVTLIANPSNGGTLTPEAGTHTYMAGKTLEIKASPAQGYMFKNWSGDYEGSSKTATITVNKNLKITANFARKTYDLTVDTTGKGTVDEKVVQNTTSSSISYNSGTTVQLTAHPATGWKFDHWEGDLTGSDNPTTITINEPKKVTAVFVQTSYELTVNHKGEGAVAQKIIQSVTSSTKSYNPGTLVQLTGNPASGWMFEHWKGDLSGSKNPAQIRMNGPKTVTAVFKGKEMVLHITIQGSGSVNKDPDSTKYIIGSIVKLTAKPGNGQEFSKWTGDVSADSAMNNPLYYKIGTSNNLTAVFKKASEGKPAGQGTKASPYLITSLANLKWLSNDSSAWDATFKQTADIDASKTKTWNNGKGFIPIGHDGDNFTGIYMGQNHTITGLYINRPNKTRIGLFSNVRSSGVIKNIHLKQVDITGGNEVGGVAGLNSGKIIGASVTGGQITGAGTGNIGGLVGANHGTIKDSQANVAVSAQDKHIGGLVGYGGKGSSIQGSHATGNITSKDEEVGGLVGDNHGTITNSYATGNVHSDGPFGGGLVGINYGPIKGSHATGDVTSHGGDAGGLVGDNHGAISNSYATGDVKGDHNNGGLVGYSPSGSIKNSFATGNVVSESGHVGGLVSDSHVVITNCYATGNATTGGGGNAGGLVGWETSGGKVISSYSIGQAINNGKGKVGGLVGGIGKGSVSQSYWNTETSKLSKSAGGTGLKTSQIQGTVAKTNMKGFDFMKVWQTNPGGYPTLRKNPPPNN